MSRSNSQYLRRPSLATDDVAHAAMFNRAVASVLVLVLMGLCGCDAGVPPIAPQPSVDAEIFRASDFGTSTDGSIIGPDDIGTTMGGCDPNPCEDGDRCINEGGLVTCQPIGCEMLTCGENERCEADEDGRGRCVDLSCSDDLDCSAEEFCDDVCTCLLYTSPSPRD